MGPGLSRPELGALSAERRLELARALRAARAAARVYRRLRAVQLVADGHPLPEAARLSDVGRTSVYNYLRAFARGGPPALEDVPRRLPRKLPPPYAGDRESHAAWRRLLARRPSAIAALETPARAWTLRLLVRYLAVVHRTEVTEATVHNALRRAGVRRGRTVRTRRPPAIR